MVYSRIGAVLLVLASSAATAQGGPIATTSTGSVWSLDRDTLKTDGGTASAWLDVDHSRDRSEAARRSRALIEIECAARQYKWVQFFSYRRNGSQMPERVRPNVEMDIAPGSPIEAVSRAICQGGG